MRQPNLQIIQEYIIKILIKRYKIIDVGKELYDLGYSEYTSWNGHKEYYGVKTIRQWINKFSQYIDFTEYENEKNNYLNQYKSGVPYYKLAKELREKGYYCNEWKHLNGEYLIEVLRCNSLTHWIKTSDLKQMHDDNLNIIKNTYVKRYLKGETNTTLSNELIQIGFPYSVVTQKSTSGKNLIYNICWCLKQWVKNYNLTMIKKQKPNDNFDKATREELEDIARLYKQAYKDKNGGRDISKKEVEKIKNDLNLKINNHSKIIFLCCIPSSTYFYKNKKGDDLKRLHKYQLDILVINSYHESHDNYGRHKIFLDLIEHGYDVTEKQIRNSMKRLKIICKYNKPSKARKDPKSNDIVENLLNCNFEYFQKGQAFCTDTSYFKTPFGMTYICGAIDLCDNEISGLKASWHNDTQLILLTYKDILYHQDNCIMNSDHGSAHLSNETREWLIQNNFRISAGRKGKSLDNRPIEFFWKIMKYEWLNNIPFNERTLERINSELMLFAQWYNNDRKQTCLKNKSPVNYAKYKFNYNLTSSTPTAGA